MPATCVLCGWAKGTVDWLLAQLFPSMGTDYVGLIIANTTAGKWYLCGGAMACLRGVVGAFVGWARSRAFGAGPGERQRLAPLRWLEVTELLRLGLPGDRDALVASGDGAGRLVSSGDRRDPDLLQRRERSHG